MANIYEMLLEDLELSFPGKAFITGQEVCRFLGCEMTVVYNWNKRRDPKRRPPSLSIGKEMKFPKRPLAKFLAEEHEARQG